MKILYLVLWNLLTLLSLSFSLLLIETIFLSINFIGLDFLIYYFGDVYLYKVQLFLLLLILFCFFFKKYLKQNNLVELKKKKKKSLLEIIFFCSLLFYFSFYFFEENIDDLVVTVNNDILINTIKKKNFSNFKFLDDILWNIYNQEILIKKIFGIDCTDTNNCKKKIMYFSNEQVKLTNDFRWEYLNKKNPFVKIDNSALKEAKKLAFESLHEYKLRKSLIDENSFISSLSNSENAEWYWDLFDNSLDRKVAYAITNISDYTLCSPDEIKYILVNEYDFKESDISSFDIKDLVNYLDFINSDSK